MSARICTRYTIKTTHWKDPRGIGAHPDDAHLVTDPDTHGVVEFVENGKAISVKEKISNHVLYYVYPLSISKIIARFTMLKS